MELISVPRAAKELGVAERTLRRAVDEGEIEAFRFGSRWVRIEREALRKWVRTKRVER